MMSWKRAESLILGEFVVCGLCVWFVTLCVLFFFLPTAEPLPLMDLCRRSVRLALGRERLTEIHGLPLPASLKNYLLYQ